MTTSSQTVVRNSPANSGFECTDIHVLYVPFNLHASLSTNKMKCTKLDHQVIPGSIVQ